MATSLPGRRASGRSPARRVAVPVLVGLAVAVLLAVYGQVHDPTGRGVVQFGFSSVLTMKAWLTTAAAALALVQLTTALRIFGRIGTGKSPVWVPVLHRVSGVVAVLLTLPVVFHCLWSLGFSTLDARTTAHSLLGCTFYGAFVAKMLALKMRRLPGWALPVFGGLVFAALVALWLTSSLWYFRTVGVGS